MIIHYFFGGVGSFVGVIVIVLDHPGDLFSVSVAETWVQIHPVKTLFLAVVSLPGWGVGGGVGWGGVGDVNVVIDLHRVWM